MLLPKRACFRGVNPVTDGCEYVHGDPEGPRRPTAAEDRADLVASQKPFCV